MVLPYNGKKYAAISYRTPEDDLLSRQQDKGKAGLT